MKDLVEQEINVMLSEKITWKITHTNYGSRRHEGCSKSFGPYIVEKEFDGSFSAYWGGAKIAEANHYSLARRAAQAHCYWLARGAQPFSVNQSKKPVNRSAGS